MRRVCVALAAGVACGSSHGMPAMMDAAVDAPSAGGAGSCVSPGDIAVGFHDVRSTASDLDATALTCHASPSLPEAVYRLVVAQPTHVMLSGSDQSGSGIGAQVRADSCTGTSVACDWAANGVLSRGIDLPAGTWVIVVERNPAGMYTFGVDP